MTRPRPGLGLEWGPKSARLPLWPALAGPKDVVPVAVAVAVAVARAVDVVAANVEHVG